MTMTTARSAIRRLYVAWQDPDSRQYHPVATLWIDDNGDRPEHVFQYLRAAGGLAKFAPFVAFPEFEREYRADDLFPFFSNRVMSPKRPDYPQFVESLGLEPTANPLAILSRGALRVTDSLEVFADPEVDDLDRLHLWCFARGVRHIDGAEAAIASCAAGGELRLVCEPSNPVNPKALLICTPAGQRLGYVPDYLVAPLHRLIDACGTDLTVRVGHVNAPPAPRQVRLLCHVETCAPASFVAFDDPGFEPVRASATTR